MAHLHVLHAVKRLISRKQNFVDFGSAFPRGSGVFSKSPFSYLCRSQPRYFLSYKAVNTRSPAHATVQVLCGTPDRTALSSQLHTNSRVYILYCNYRNLIFKFHSKFQPTAMSSVPTQHCAQCTDIRLLLQNCIQTGSLQHARSKMSRRSRVRP